MQEDRIIGALIGLIGACNNNPKTANTDSVVAKALAFPLLCPGYGDEEVRGIIDEIYAEKNAVAPGCALCASPCGNTSDYDMSRIYNAGGEVRSVKTGILSELQKIALYICRCQENGAYPEEDMKFLYKALCYISYDLEQEQLLALFAQAQEMNLRI